jgi:hypothetical protein
VADLESKEQGGERMKGSIGLIAAILMSYPAHAQNDLLEPRLRPVPPRTAIADGHTADFAADLPIDVNALASELKSQFENYMKIGQQPAPACDAVEAADYVLALHVAGRFDDCGHYAESCSKLVNSPRVLAEGASCHAAHFQYDQADQLYKAATGAQFANSDEYADAVFSYAEFSLYWIHPEKVSAILSLNKAWSASELKLWEAVIKRAGALDLGDVSKADVDHFLNLQIERSSGATQSHLKALRLSILDSDYKFDQAMKQLSQDANSLKNPLLWYSLAYSAVYSGLNDRFAEARKIYDVSDLYSNPYSILPGEQNTYNYTEIYNSVCPKQLMSGEDRVRFEAFKAQIRSGAISSATALEQAADFTKNFSDRADVLTTYAGLLALSGQHQLAMQTYWRAHRHCRYYNRANWGLVLEKRFQKYSSFPDYDSNTQKVERELKSRHIPQEISTFISDWNALDSTTQRRVEYGMRIWLPWIHQLHANGFSAYIKFSFDLLSDSPGSADLRDQRIGGIGYPNDNRLWDDVRGAGGETVLADANEVFQTVQGDYNLLGHEMTHQFQALLEAKYPPGVACVQSTYDHAKADKNFPDPYSSQNKEEHFAQGVTYYLVPSDSPKRFGLNQTWLVQHDPEQLNFIESIEAAAGDFERIACQDSRARAAREIAYPRALR